MIAKWAHTAGVLLAVVLPTACAQDLPQIPAFPGAEGFGAKTVGGRGGSVYIVTSLEDYDVDEKPIAGSLRAAVEADGRRTIVFEVSGYIELKRTLDIVHPHVTIAAQSAPGDGIALKRYGVEVFASDVVLRYLRVRPGDVAGIELDALNIRGENVIVDHCSVSWGTDEVLSAVGRANNVTIQWCLISESLNHSVHHKGPHGYGTLLTASGDVSIHHSIYAYHSSRNPRPKDLLLDFRNNLVFGFGIMAGYNYADHTRMDYVGNVIRPLAYSQDPRCAFDLGGLNSRFFVKDNVVIDSDTTFGDWEFICTPDSISRADVDALVRLPAPNVVSGVTTEPPLQALLRMMKSAGAVLPARDRVDTRVIDTMMEGGGGLVDSQEEVGGWLPLAPGVARRDSDRDGMPDEWESASGLSPEDPNDHAGDRDQDGYTNLEEFLNGTDPTVAD